MTTKEDAAPMLIAIVHYHLNRGGVTQVIANHLRALRHAGGATATFASWSCSRRPVAPAGPIVCRRWTALDYTVRVVPGLDYDDAQSCGTSRIGRRD